MLLHLTNVSFGVPFDADGCVDELRYSENEQEVAEGFYERVDNSKNAVASLA